MQARYYYVLCAEPLILGSTGARPRGGKIRRPELPTAIPRYSLLQHFSWVIGSSAMADIRVAQQAGQERGIDYHAMVSSAAENELRIQEDVIGAHVGHNIHVNEHIFRPLPVEKKYHAVYVAQLKPFKRFELAQRIPKLTVISYGGDLHEFCPALSHADFNRGFVNNDEVATTINSAVAGLCLSAEEGQMNASIEYLMCGLPIVTTPSRGGRDEYFDADNSLTVEPKSDAIAAAVETWHRLSPTPETIRARALHKLQQRRDVYCRYIAALIKKLTGRVVESEWLQTLYYQSERGMTGREIGPRRVGDPEVMAPYLLELPHHVPQRRNGIEEHDDQQGLKLVNAAGTPLVCNESGKSVWERCDGRANIAEIVAGLAEDFSVTPDLIRRDVLDCLGSFHKAGLVHGRRDAPG